MKVYKLLKDEYNLARSLPNHPKNPINPGSVNFTSTFYNCIFLYACYNILLLKMIS